MTIPDHYGRIEPIPPGPYVDPRQRGADPEPIGSTHVRSGIVDVKQGETPIDAMRRYVRGGGRIEDIPGWGETKIAAPPRPGIVPPGLEMPWPEWRTLARELDAPPGWSACRFPTWRAGEQRPDRANPEDAGECAFVFGIVRGDFGIWRSPFPVCHTGDDGMLIEQREDVLAAVTHLPTGLGMGIFNDRDSAIASCNAAEGLGIDWRLLNPNDKRGWMLSFSRLRQAREFAGITVCRSRHAHQGNPDGPPLAIWEQRAEAVAEGRPEKLS